MPELSTGIVGTPSPKRQRAAHVQAAANGYIVNTQNIDNWEQTTTIAKDASEVAEIIRAYFAQE